MDYMDVRILLMIHIIKDLSKVFPNHRFSYTIMYVPNFITLKLISSKHPALLNSTLWSIGSSDDKTLIVLIMLVKTENTCYFAM